MIESASNQEVVPSEQDEGLRLEWPKPELTRGKHHRSRHKNISHFVSSLQSIDEADENVSKNALSDKCVTTPDTVSFYGSLFASKQSVTDSLSILDAIDNIDNSSAIVDEKEQKRECDPESDVDGLQILGDMDHEREALSDVQLSPMSVQASTRNFGVFGNKKKEVGQTSDGAKPMRRCSVM